MFDNFDNFAFMNDMLAEPLTVTIAGKQTGTRDAHGQPIKDPDTTRHVDEPIVNTTNPNLNFNAGIGGELPVGTLYWLSDFNDVPKDTKVVRDNHPDITYTVINRGDDIAAGKTYYQIKEVGSDER